MTLPDPAPVLPGRLPELLLVRLLGVSKLPPTAAKLSRDLAPFFRAPPSPSTIDAAATRLRAEGALTPSGFVLTEPGRARALALLGVAGSEVGPKTTWTTLRSRLLPAMVLGVAPVVAAKLSEDRLLALLLARRLDLSPDTASARAALEAVVCRELGYPDVRTLDALLVRVLAARIGADPSLPAEQVERQAPRVLLGLPRGGGALLRDHLLVGWADPPPVRADVPAPDSVDLPTFATAVESAARESRSGWFGDQKVFVAHVWDQVRGRPGFRSMDLDTFKQHILEANARDLLTLSRADLVQLMNPDDVKRSETRGRNAVFHFVRVEGGRRA